MPGLHLLVGKDGGISSNWGTQWRKIAPSLFHSPGYSSNVVVEEPSLWIGSTGFEDYPVKYYQTPDAIVVIEGYIYNNNHKELNRELAFLSNALCNSRKESLSLIRPWVLSADGDYVIVILDKRKPQLWLFNDPMGRLPIYYHHAKNRLLISREVKFITASLANYEYDRFGIAETLIFGYTLGYSTLIKDVNRLDGGVLMSVDLTNNLEVKIQRTYEFNLDALLDAPEKKIKEHAVCLAERFLKGCENIKSTFPEHTHVVSLSGGFDSRSVLAGMKRIGSRVCAFTFQDGGTATRGCDARYAAEIAQLLGVPWQLINRPRPGIADIEHLLWIKDGLNYAAMAFIMPLHRGLRETYGPKVLHLTGDNGDRSMDPQGPPVHINNFDHFSRFVIERHSRCEVQDVSNITGLACSDLIESINHKFARYPEKNMGNRYRHFILAERLFNWNFQAEDRNRTYLWHATPFSSFPYFEYAMGVPDNAKKYWQLFEEFFRVLEPQCLDVYYANWEAPITSYLRYLNPFKQLVYERLPAWLRILIRDRTLYRGLKVEDFLREYLNKCLEGLGNRSRFLNVEKTLEYTKACNINSFDNIVTFIAYMKVHDEKIAQIKANLKQR